MYAAMIIPNCGQFLYVKFKKSHSFFNPAHLNLRQLQWDLNAGPASNGMRLNMGHGRGGCEEENGHECEHSQNGALADGGNGNHLGEVFADAGIANSLQCMNPLFMSAVSASTMFFFGPSNAMRSSSDAGSSGPSRQEGGRTDM